MPSIHTRVSKPISKETEAALAKALGEAIELIPGKSEKWLMLQFEENCRMYFQGKNENPLAFVTVKLVGSASNAAYENLTAEITRLLSSSLAISPDCIYVQYEETDHWGWNGTNFYITGRFFRPF